MINYQMIAASALNKPLAMDISYARVFFSALGLRLGADSLVDAAGNELTRENMHQVAASYLHPVTGEYRHYSIIDGVAVLPIHGALAHKTGNVRPRSGLQGYDGIQAMLDQAVTDPEVKGIYMDNHTPGGTVFGAFDTADAIRRANSIKPVWAIANDMNCSAGQLIAAAAGRRLVTQTGVVGSIGVVVAHCDYEKYLENEGIKITLLHSGSQKVDGNPYQALPKDVASRWQKEIDDTRRLFASKVAQFTGLSLQHVLETEAATYTGQSAVDIGLADELVHSTDGIAMLSSHVKTLNRTITMGTTAMKNAYQDQAAKGAENSGIDTTITHDQKEPVITPQPASAEVLVALCDKAGMPEQIGSMIKSGLTEDAAKGRLENLGKVRDTLAAANLGHIFAHVSAKMDDPAAMLKVALTAATAHGDDKEVSATKHVDASEAKLKQPDVKTAYKNPSRL